MGEDAKFPMIHVIWCDGCHFLRLGPVDTRAALDGMCSKQQASNEKNPGCLGCIGDYNGLYMIIPHSYELTIVGIPINYKATSKMESKRDFFVAQVFFSFPAWQTSRLLIQCGNIPLGCST